MGEPVGGGLTAKAAKELGLAADTPVGVSIIDAHAGGLGLLGAPLGKGKVSPHTLGSRLALIGEPPRVTWRCRRSRASLRASGGRIFPR